MGPVRGLPKLVGDGSLHFRKTESHLHCELKSLRCCKRYFNDCKYLLFCLFLTAKRLGWPELWAEQEVTERNWMEKRRQLQCSADTSKAMISELSVPSSLSRACPAYGCPSSPSPSQAVCGESLKLWFVTPGRKGEREVCQNVTQGSTRAEVQ